MSTTAISVPEWTLDTALRLLRRSYPDFDARIAGRDVIDYGCGEGWQAVAMAYAGARSVTGLDIVPGLLDIARGLAGEHGVQHRVTFCASPPPDLRADVVISQNSMEHFPDPLGTLRTMRSMLREGGVALVTFGPPWLAPFGHHMHYFAPVPWLNLLAPERLVMALRRRHIDDGATRYEECGGGLNKMTLRKFERLVAQAGFHITYRNDVMVKHMPRLLGRVPLLREFVTNHVTAELRVGAH